MRKDAFMNRLEAAGARNRVLMFMVLCLFVLTAWNTIALHQARTQTQITLVPIGGGSGMTVGYGKASDEYLRQMARYVSQMVGVYTASSARPQLQELLSLFAPEVVGKVQGEFEKIAVQIERYPSISSIMRWTGEAPLRISPNLLQVAATKDRLVNGNVSESVQVHYCIGYRIAESRFWITSLQEMEGPGKDLCFLPPKALSEEKNP